MQYSELKKKAIQFAMDHENIEPNPDQIKAEFIPVQPDQDDLEQPPRYKARVILNEFVANIAVRLDGDTGQLVSWNIPERYKAATETIIDREEVMLIASEAVEIPDEAEIEEFSQVQKTDSHITNIIYHHLVNDLEVEGDCIAIQINSKTREIISLARIWNDVVDYENKLSMEDAERIARQEAPAYTRGKNFDIQVMGQSFIPVVVDSSDGNKPVVRYVKVWVIAIVELGIGYQNLTRLDIDALTGDIVRTERSR